MKKKDYLLLISWCTYVSAYLCRVNFSAVLSKMSTSLDISLDTFGLISGVYFVTYAVGQLINGFIGDRISPYRYILLASLACGTLNLAMSQGNAHWQFLLIWGANGFFQSIFWSSILRLLSFYFESDQAHKRVSTVMSTCSVTGYILSWSLLGKLLLGAQWTSYFILPAMAMLAMVPLWLYARKAFPMEALAQRTTKRSIKEVIAIFRREKLFLVAFLCMCIGAMHEGAVFWLPVVFEQYLHIDTSSSFLLLALIPFAKLLGVFTARYLLGRCQEAPEHPERILLSTAFVLICILIWTSQSYPVVTAALIAVLVLVLNGANWLLISYMPLFFGKRNLVATLIGIFDFATYMGAALCSTLSGKLLSYTSFTGIVMLWAVFSVLAFLFFFSGARGCIANKGQAVD